MVMVDIKRRIDKEDKSPFTLSFRFSKDLVEKINNHWKEDGFANRTALVEAACNFFFDTLECPRCKNRNHKNSLYCSICGNTLNPSYELKKSLKQMYDEFLEYQERTLSLEIEVNEERDEYYKKISSPKLNPELKSSLEDILCSAADDYWLGVTLRVLEKDNLEEIYQAVPVLGFHRYAYQLNEVQTFFQSSTYLKDIPHLTPQITNGIESLIGDLIDFQINYGVMLKSDLNLYLQVNKLIDKLTEN